MNISNAIKSLDPSAQFSIIDDNIATIEWISKSVELTNEDIILERDRLLAIYNSLEYQRLRQPEYPPITDLADAIYWQSQGDDTKMAAYISAVEAVKQKYPKEVNQ